MRKILEIKNKGKNLYFIKSNVEANHKVKITMLDQKDNCVIDNISFAFINNNKYSLLDKIQKTIVGLENCLKIEVFSDYDLDNEVITFERCN
jgi:hypothetical protein